MLIFSITSINSFEVVQHMNDVLLEAVGVKYVPRIIVGNKNDLEDLR